MAEMTQPTDRNNRPIPIGSSISSEQISVTSVKADAVGDYAGKCVRVRTNTNCYYRITGADATAGAPSIYLGADEKEYEYVPVGGGISVIRETTDGTFIIDLLG